MLMKPFVGYQVKNAFTFGDKDLKSNLQDPLLITKYINSYSNLSFTYTSTIAIEGNTYYSLPVHSHFCYRRVLFNLQMLDSNCFDCGQKKPFDDEVGCVSPT
jgi:hypothetical protein